MTNPHHFNWNTPEKAKKDLIGQFNPLANKHFSAHPYIDMNGNKRIGHGLNMKTVDRHLPELVRKGKRPITKQESEEIFNKTNRKK